MAKWSLPLFLLENLELLLHVLHPFLLKTNSLHESCRSLRVQWTVNCRARLCEHDWLVLNHQLLRRVLKEDYVNTLLNHTVPRLYRHVAEPHSPKCTWSLTTIPNAVRFFFFFFNLWFFVLMLVAFGGYRTPVSIERAPVFRRQCLILKIVFFFKFWKKDQIKRLQLMFWTKKRHKRKNRLGCVHSTLPFRHA